MEGGEGTLVLEQVIAGLWSLADNGIYYLDVAARSPEGATPLMWLSFATHKLVQVGAVRKPIIAVTPSLSVTSDGRRIAWSQIDREESELMLIENFSVGTVGRRKHLPHNVKVSTGAPDSRTARRRPVLPW